MQTVIVIRVPLALHKLETTALVRECGYPGSLSVSTWGWIRSLFSGTGEASKERQNLTIMETDRLSEGLSSINMDMVDDTKGVYWPGFVALGAGTFAIFNFLTRWLLPGGETYFLRRKYTISY